MTTSPNPATTPSTTPPHSITPHVRIDNVHRRFGSASHPIDAVNDLTFQIARGETVALLGPNGAGKTTTLHMLLGLDSPTRGTITVAGRPPRDAIAADEVGAVLQTGELLRDFTVRETLEAIASCYTRHIPLQNVATDVGISGLERRRVGQLSGGQRQRLKFALALLPDPDLLVLDEPTAGLDASARTAFWDSVRARHDRGATVLFATHYLTEAEEFADRIVVMAHGRLAAAGTPAELARIAGASVVRATAPTGQGPALAARYRSAASPAADPVRRVELHGDQVVITTDHADDIARDLLNHTDATNLLITRPTLDDAFAVLTNHTAKEPS